MWALNLYVQLNHSNLYNEPNHPRTHILKPVKVIRFIVPEPRSPFSLRIILYYINYLSHIKAGLLCHVGFVLHWKSRSFWVRDWQLSNPIPSNPDSWHLYWPYIDTLIQSKMRCPKIPLFFTITFAITPFFLWKYSLVFMHWCLVITRRKTAFRRSKQRPSFETPFVEPTFVPKAS